MKMLADVETLLAKMMNDERGADEPACGPLGAGVPTRPWKKQAVIGEPISVHTHGLVSLGFPELEMLPGDCAFLYVAAEMLDAVADHMLESGQMVEPGEAIGLGEVILLAEDAKDTPGLDGDDSPRLVLRGVRPECEHCGREANAVAGHVAGGDPSA